MEYTFGQKCLVVYSLLDGKILANAYSNKLPNRELEDFKSKYYRTLSRYIETHSEEDYEFLLACTNNIHKISEDQFDFV
jgi:hypothetical protein